MSLPEEKYRAIFNMQMVLLSLIFSKKCRISKAWRKEVYYALKHAPFSSDNITISDPMGAKTFQGGSTVSLDQIKEYVKLIDKVKLTPKKRKKKK